MIDSPYFFSINIIYTKPDNFVSSEIEDETRVSMKERR